jgi:hypothetical protein
LPNKRENDLIMQRERKREFLKVLDRKDRSGVEVQ